MKIEEFRGTFLFDITKILRLFNTISRLNSKYLINFELQLY